MEIIREKIDFQLDNKTAVAIGKFDGVHNGHALILNKLKEYRDKGLKTAVLTFDFPPSMTLTNAPAQVLTTNIEKRLIFREMGVDIMVEFPFYEKTAMISAEDFIEDILVGQMKMAAVVVGEDCAFGHKAAGNADLLKKMGDKFGYETVVIPKLKDGDEVISSTYLRELIIEGKVAKVASLSPNPYFVYGDFKTTGGIGQKFGLPFCVMDIPEDKLLPRDGVYMTKVLYEDCYYPSISFVLERKRCIETYMYEGTRDIGRESVAIGFFEFLRDSFENDDTAFISQEKRIEQFRLELEKGRGWHREHPV